MKRLGIYLLMVMLVACNAGKKEPVSDREGLSKRLEAFMDANRAQDISKVLDYTYPKVFEMAPRDMMEKTMKESYNNNAFAMKMDSLKIDSLYPIFTSGKGQYAKAVYSMALVVTVKTSDSAAAGLDDYISTFVQKFGEEHVRKNEADQTIHINMQNVMICAKDEFSKDWTFVNLKEGEAIMDKLLPKEVQDKISNYK